MSGEHRLGEQPRREAIADGVQRPDARRIERVAIVAQPSQSTLCSSYTQEIDALLVKAAIDLAPVTAEQADAARRAWRRFGKGNHPAALNFGDRFAYALAKATGEPLLFKCDDFARTDIEAPDSA